MKKLLLFITSLMASIDLSAQGIISETERKFAQAYLEKTSQEFLKSIENLTEGQLVFKSKESKWNILECAEHIAITEETLRNVIQKQLKLPADSVLGKSLRITEKKIIDRLTFRLIKVNAPEQIKPTGRFTNILSAKHAFIQQRQANISYVISNNDALLHHYWKHPATGTINLYHTIILMAAHCKRHTLQIEEIKNHKAFPKS